MAQEKLSGGDYASRLLVSCLLGSHLISRDTAVTVSPVVAISTTTAAAAAAAAANRPLEHYTRGCTPL